MAVAIAGFLRPSSASADTITPAGAYLATTLDSMQVTNYWLEGAFVDWLTGKPVYTTDPDDTHCSAFAAAAAARFGIYLLRPPEHSTTLLSNAQYDWLVASGTNYGWQPVTQWTNAQHLANLGQLVVASWKNPDTNDSGHIVVLRPSTKSMATILSEGPEECQASNTNYNDTNVQFGFRIHPGAFPDEILYFSHVITNSATPVLQSCSWSNHVFHGTLAGYLGRSYQLQASTNYMNWTTVLYYTNSSVITNPVPVVDSVNNLPLCFYRVISQ